MRPALADLLAVGDDPPAGRIVQTADDPGRAQQAWVRLRTGSEEFPALLLVPPRAHRTSAAVVALAGHGPGASALVDDRDHYHRGLAGRLVERGVTVLAPELTSFGTRRAPSATGDDTGPSCQVDAMSGLLRGRPVLGTRVDEARAAVSALSGLSWVDQHRIGIVGGSGGGAVAVLTAALDRRVSATLVGQWLSSFAASLESVPHCICNAVPGLARHFSMAGLAALIAPRGLVLENGRRDPIFPVDAAVSSHRQLSTAWTSRGVEAPELILTERAHQWEGVRSVTALLELLTASPT